MTANASIKFTGATTGAGGDGRALIGIQGEVVTVANADNTSVDKAQFEILYAPPGSAITRGVKQAYSSTLTWQFTPDSSESFLVRLRVKDVNGNESVDDRVFSVLEVTGRLLGPFKGSARSMNYSAQTDGWWPYHRAYFKAVDYHERVLPIGRWQKDAVDGAAGTATSELPIGSARAASTVTEVRLTPLANLTANNSNFATLTLSKRTAGGSLTTIATLVTNVAGGNWSAFVSKTFTIAAGAVAADDVLTLGITKTGTGVIVPIFALEVFGKAA